MTALLKCLIIFYALWSVFKICAILATCFGNEQRTNNTGMNEQPTTNNENISPMKNYQQKAVESEPLQQRAQTALVVDYMAKNLITFRPETKILRVIETLLEYRITGAPVLNEKDQLVGLIDDKDCLKVLFDGAYHNQPVDNKTVAHYMSNVMKTISPETDIYEVADLFLNTVYKRLLVVDEDGRLLGQISRQDVLKAIHDFNMG